MTKALLEYSGRAFQFLWATFTTLGLPISGFINNRSQIQSSVFCLSSFICWSYFVIFDKNLNDDQR